MSKARELANLGNAYSDGALSNRNLIINGAMQVAQRGTSFTANGYGLDRWFFDRYLSGSSRTMSQDTDAPEGFSHSLKYANGGLAEDQYYFIQKIERKNFERLSGQTVTASFYVKASEAITAARWYLTVNGDGTGNDEASTGTYDITTSWQRVTFTVTLGDFSGYTITDSGFMEMIPMLAVDPHPNIPANASLWFTGVQLEVGDTATPFEHRSYGDELARCERYYQSSFDGNTGPSHDSTDCVYSFVKPFSGTSAAGMGERFRVQMRSTPTVTLWTASSSPSTTSGRITYYDGSWKNGAANIHTSTSGDGFAMDGSFTSGMSLMQYNYEADAEL